MNKYCIFVISVFGCHHHKIVHIILMSVVSNFEIYSVTHSTRVWNHWNVHVEWVYIRVWRIFGYSNIFWYKYLFLSYSYHFFYMNIFGYSFVSFFDTNIFKRTNLMCAPKSPKDKWLKLFTHRLIFKDKLLPLCCVNYVLSFCCITHQKSNI